jgi:hypothetical protein
LEGEEDLELEMGTGEAVEDDIVLLVVWCVRVKGLRWRGHTSVTVWVALPSSTDLLF